ncbi:hypothetical protein CSW98_06460 [Vibrio sp. HA2012]|nr:hypothetical protein CSW98_06460 [Vibrio sp. HA2012]
MFLKALTLPLLIFMTAFQADDAGSIPAARSNSFPLHRTFQPIENKALYNATSCFFLLPIHLIASS